MFAARSSGSRAPSGRSPSDSAKPSASSSSWPGVRIVTATGRPPIRISSGSSTATTSSSSPSGTRTTSTLVGRSTAGRAIAKSRLAAVQVVVVGSGAREHALAWRLAPSPALTELHAAPGNPGIAALGRCHPVRADDGDGLLGLALTLDADLVVIGPEGAARRRRRRRAAAERHRRLRARARRRPGSRARRRSPRTCCAPPASRRRRRSRSRAPPCVVKADGLAAGQGRLRLPHGRGARRGAARRRGARRRAS